MPSVAAKFPVALGGTQWILKEPAGTASAHRHYAELQDPRLLLQNDRILVPWLH